MVIIEAEVDSFADLKPLKDSFNRYFSFKLKFYSLTDLFPASPVEVPEYN